MGDHSIEQTNLTATETAQETFIAPELFDEYIKTEIEFIVSHIMPEDTSYFDITEVANTSTDKIIADLNERGIINIYAFKQVGYYLIIEYNKDGEKQSISFDLSPHSSENHEYLGNKSYQEVVAEENKKKAALRKENEALSNMLAAMEHVFNENGEEFWQELGQEDTLSTNEFDIDGISLEGKNIKDIQKLAQDKIAQIKLIRLSIFSDKIPSDPLIQDNFKTYLGYITGTGLGSQTQEADFYESGAEYFEKSEAEVNFLIDEFVASFDSFDDMFIEVGKIHSSIDDNNYQTTTVERNYKHFSDRLNHAMLEQLRKKYASKEDFYTYAQLVSGRNYSVKGVEYSGNMDSRLYSPDMANKALLHTMTQPNGMIEQIASNISFEDSLVGKQTPNEIFSEASDVLTQSLSEGNPNAEINGKNLLSDMGFSHLETLKTPYKNLPYSEQIKVSTLARLIKKLKIHTYEPSYPGTLPTEATTKIHSKLLSDLPEIFKEIGEDAISDLTDEMNSKMDWSFGNFDGLNAQEAGFKEGSSEARIYDLFRDINGSGAFYDFSDGTLEGIKDVTMMAAIVVGALIVGGIVIAALPAVGAAAAGVSGSLIGATAASNVLIQGGIYGVSASMTSWAIDYGMGDAKGYGNMTEAATNISSDLFVGGATGVFGGYLVSKYGVEGAKALSMGSVKNKGIFAGDLLFLGVGPEMGRMYIMDQIFHNKLIFQENSPEE